MERSGCVWLPKALVLTLDGASASRPCASKSSWSLDVELGGVLCQGALHDMLLLRRCDEQAKWNYSVAPNAKTTSLGPVVTGCAGAHPIGSAKLRCHV